MPTLDSVTSIRGGYRYPVRATGLPRHRYYAVMTLRFDGFERPTSMDEPRTTLSIEREKATVLAYVGVNEDRPTLVSRGVAQREFETWSLSREGVHTHDAWVCGSILAIFRVGQARLEAWHHPEDGFDGVDEALVNDLQPAVNRAAVDFPTSYLSWWAE